jgi:hypothetical protein
MRVCAPPRRATPLKKVTTLSEATLRMAARARNKQACVISGDVGGGEEAAACGNAELVVRTAWDGWVVVRAAAAAAAAAVASGNGATSVTARMACDTLPLPTLHGAAAHMQRLCDDACPGRFSGFV